MDATFEENEKETYVSLTEEKNHFTEYHYLLAGFWIRFWAYLVDLLVISSVNRIIVHPLFSLLGINTSESFFSPLTIVTTVTFFAYFVLLTKYFGQTLGKMIFGLKVRSLKGDQLTWSTILFREFIGRYISKFLFVGYIVAAFTPKKQGLHDIFADTQVIHEKLFVQKNEDLPVASKPI
ncbi:RDD family protein [Metabacillus sp. HB246100]|uniref:RDD family protein n=1 Tax=Bacillus weihaiensis TaxID=1547283 RepID=UPI002352FD8B|nr:RDD family protein [Bacillus weihaiensis]